MKKPIVKQIKKVESSDEESEEEDSDIAPDLGMKLEPAKHVQQSTQDRLNNVWKKFANAVDCDCKLERELSAEKKLTNDLRRQLAEERTHEKQLTALTERTKSEKEEIVSQNLNSLP